MMTPAGLIHGGLAVDDGTGKGYYVLQAVCSAICPASVGHVLPFCMGQNILANEWIIFMPFICN
jgi:hypothetical protein